MTSNFREKANFIWQVADDTLCVLGTFKVHENGDVIFHLWSSVCSIDQMIRTGRHQKISVDKKQQVAVWEIRLA